ncbi:UNVERIFIED_CONTAM: hypothetical protein GTU68_014489 [Idotea baltica]|nr:hypothetical protein [Idotea baltica]
MQLMPPTAARFGVTDAFDVRDNIKGGTAYLDWLLNEFDNGVIFALAGYNAGEGAVRNNNGIPPYPENASYVPKYWLHGKCAGPLHHGRPNWSRMDGL